MSSMLTSRPFTRLALVAAVALPLAGCASELTRTGSSPAYLLISSIQGAAGAEPDTFGTPLLSDVQTFGSVFNDLGRATMRVGLKNPGPSANPTAPSSLNSITIERYRVTYRRSDGRNTQGVDIPFAFDGAVTTTVPANGEATFAFDVVRNQAKLEEPLRSLRGLGGALIISTIAEIEFFGRDQAGNEVIATGTLSVNFADFADPIQGQ
ncbi:MAG: hypothetical protein OEW19_21350 [Acidobacteriota bacterium]|nr:hypothetical protein [Acidobacteriota bacterium]